MEKRSLLLTCFDSPLPEPLNGKRPVLADFAVALVLTPAQDQRSLAKLSLSWQSDPMAEDITLPGVPELQDLWQGNPAARSLPLLEALARGKKADVGFRFPEKGRLTVALRPC